MARFSAARRLGLLGLASLSALLVPVTSAQSTVVQAVPGLHSPPPLPTLRALATARGLLFGGAVNASLFDTLDPDYARIVKTEYNTVVAENAMKWAALHTGQDGFVFNLADAIVKRAQDNGQTVRGHTLIWHDSTAPWLLNIRDRATMQAAMRGHIMGVMKHFAGQVPLWDVVNEAVSDAPDHALRSSPFLNVGGPDYIDQAFRWAHAADPKARLFYNDYGAEGLNGQSDAVYRLVRGMLARGVPINGVGFQSHLDTAFSVADSGMVRNLQRFRDLGLEVQLTEVDVQLTGGGSDQVKLQRQAQVYADLMRACLTVRCTGFIMWGVSDLTSWRSAGRPLIFDENYARKPAYDALYRVLSGER